MDLDSEVRQAQEAARHTREVVDKLVSMAAAEDADYVRSTDRHVSMHSDDGLENRAVDQVECCLPYVSKAWAKASEASRAAADARRYEDSPGMFEFYEKITLEACREVQAARYYVVDRLERVLGKSSEYPRCQAVSLPSEEKAWRLTDTYTYLQEWQSGGPRRRWETRRLGRYGARWRATLWIGRTVYATAVYSTQSLAAGLALERFSEDWPNL